ncbi:unnamed protein product [Discosporangium mesarthrocarpum]
MQGLLLRVRRSKFIKVIEAERTESTTSSEVEGDREGSPPSSPSEPPMKIPIDVITTERCQYHPVPWCKRKKRLAVNTVDVLNARRLGYKTRPSGASVCLGCSYLPNEASCPLGIFSEKMFCGRFSGSGDQLLTACQDWRIRLYDTRSVYRWGSKRPQPEHSGEISSRAHHLGDSVLGSSSLRGLPGSKAWEGAPEPLKTINCRDVGWSIISTDFSPDEKWLAYSSWSHYVHLCNTQGEYELHEALDFHPVHQGHFCLFTIQFSPGNTHILGAGSDKCVHLYSLERKERETCIEAHSGDVNAVAYTDQGGQVVISGGDDCVLKVWDLRSPNTAVGGLCGHQAGVTCITAKGDGHHLISNSRDQTIKLWDLRKGLDPKDKKLKQAASLPSWDYRWENPVSPPHTRLADVSIRTFEGHVVRRTLIRCYFSPEHSTGQRFIYSGSSDGRVCIWDLLTGEMERDLSWHQDNTRDVSWHPELPLIASFSWDRSVGLFGYHAKED